MYVPKNTRALAIVAMYRSQHKPNMSVLAKHFGVSRERIRQILANNGITGRATQAIAREKRLVIEAAARAAHKVAKKQAWFAKYRPIIEAYRAGTSYKEMSERFGRCPQSICRILRVAGELNRARRPQAVAEASRSVAA